MKGAFCPKCGSKEVVDVFCAKCLKEERPLVTAFKPFTADLCTRSGAVKFHGTWHPSDNPKATLERLFQQQVVLSPDAKIKRIRVVLPPLEQKDGLLLKGEASVIVTGSASPHVKAYDEEYLVPFAIQNRLSPKVAKHGTTYFEGTLQVRNETPERQSFLKEKLAQYGGGIAKQVREKRGTDYFVTSKSAIEKTARALQECYGGLIKSSVHLFGRDKQRSRDVYRSTWFIELPPFDEGDAVELDGRLLFVEALGKRIACFNPARGKREHHEYKEGRWRLLTSFETSVAAVAPRLTVIHPETFQAVPVAGTSRRQQFEPGEQVRVVLFQKKLYLLPSLS